MLFYDLFKLKVKRNFKIIWLGHQLLIIGFYNKKIKMYVLCLIVLSFTKANSRVPKMIINSTIQYNEMVNFFSWDHLLWMLVAIYFFLTKKSKKFQITKDFCKNIRKNWGPITDNKFWPKLHKKISYGQADRI